jgi:LysM repeat protein
MTVRRSTAALVALTALWLGAGCGGDSLPYSVETDEPAYRQGQQLVKQGRDAEALAAFLRVIEKRGEQASAESHLDAGLIYLNRLKDPIEAIHHFQKYRELQPKSQQAPYVVGLIDRARLEFARALAAHPLENQAASDQLLDQVNRLQRENEELKAELGSVRTAAPLPSLHTSRVTIDANPTSAPPVRNTFERSPITLVPAGARTAPDEAALLMQPAPKPLLFAPPASTKPGAAATSTGRKHTVAPGETLFGIARKYGVKMEDLQAANRDIVPSVTASLPRGAELKIP